MLSEGCEFDPRGGLVVIFDLHNNVTVEYLELLHFLAHI